MSDQNTSLPVRSEADVDERLQSKIVDFTTPSQGMEVDSDNDAHVKAKLRDDSGNAFGTIANPVAVVQTTSTPGDAVCDYQTTSSVAKNATTTHTYTVTALKTLRALRVWCSGSGKIRAEIKVGATGSTATKAVGFNSTSTPNIDFDFESDVTVAAGDLVEIVIENRDNQAQDLYSTLQGIES